ncbi:hypothetical protein CHS0354_019566 [Potamilus streckersoni]|uniref:Ankyrin repeat protein n=1 Tax=Potamilus streckersoni TaxID=2493646 RepID=A0AAE0WCG9_9BIVA|nr:hypothetical protein CHS0354_019566 [Potamilus streckersoni]
MKPSSMSGHDPLKDAVALFVLLKGEVDRLVDFGQKLVKRNKTYAKTVFITEVDGWTPFHAFVLRGERKMVKIALKAGVDVNLPMGKPEGLPGNCSPLHLAAHRGDVSVISVLLSNGADVNVRDGMGRAPIFYASHKQNTLAVKTLVRAGADLKLCGRERKQSVSSENTTVNPITCFLACSGIRR